MENKKTMINKTIKNIKTLKKESPLTHCITNFVTVNDCANAVLAIGGSPIMSNESQEAEELGNIINSLLINIGTLTKNQIKAMEKASAHANKLNKPFVLDPVGAGVSQIRNQTTVNIIKNSTPSIIRGNLSEIKTIATLIGILEECSTTKGVDVAEDDKITEENLKDLGLLVKNIAKKLETTIAVSGPIDIISNGEKTYYIRNGDKMMSQITGTGCMLGCIMASYTAITNPLEAAITATVTFGIAGEISAEKSKNKGTGTFRTNLIDELSTMTPEKIEKYGKISEK